MNPTSSPVLVGTGLTMTFGGVKALRDVDIALEPGDHVGLIGPNGSGKTTLLNVLSGVYRATSGAVRLRDAEVTRFSAGRRARMGIVRTFQHPQLARSLTLRENVLVGQRLGERLSGSTAPSGADELMEMFGCAAYADELPEAAPYGMSKLAEVARAAAAAGPVMLLDEPAAGLSHEERTELVRALRAHREIHPEQALCLIEHDVPMVSAVCDRLVVLNAGSELAAGPPEEVLEDQRVRDAYLGAQAQRPVETEEQTR